MNSTSYIAWAGFVLSLSNLIYIWTRNHWRSVDFLAEIIYINKEEDGADRPDENGNFQKGSRMEMYIINKGCPITILGIYFEQTQNKTFQMHIDSLPARLECRDVIKIQEPFPHPVNREKIEDENVCFYLLDEKKKKRYEMKKMPRIAGVDQPYVSRLNPNKKTI